jgi:hypothetical protein
MYRVNLRHKIAVSKNHHREGPLRYNHGQRDFHELNQSAFIVM